MSKKSKGITKQILAVLLAAVMVMLPAAEVFAENGADTRVAEEVCAAEGIAEYAEEQPDAGTVPEEEILLSDEETEDQCAETGSSAEDIDAEDVQEDIEEDIAGEDGSDIPDETGEEAEDVFADEDIDTEEEAAEDAEADDAEDEEPDEDAAAEEDTDLQPADGADPEESIPDQDKKEIATDGSEPEKAENTQAEDAEVSAVPEETAVPAESVLPAETVLPETSADIAETGIVALIKTAVLEAAGAKAAAVSAAEVFDNSTKMASGEYTEGDWTSYTWGGGTGKARLDLQKIIVKNGKAEGVFKASSSNMTHVYYAGNTGSNEEDKDYYDPDTDTCGDMVLPIEDQLVTFPIKLNEEAAVACRTTAMSVPHWVQYTYTIEIDIIEEEDRITDLTVTNDFEGLTISEASLAVNSVNTTLSLTAGDSTFTKLFFGTAAQAEEDSSAAVSADSGNVFSTDASSYIGKKAKVAFYSSEDKIWHEGTMKIDQEAGTITLKEGEKADYSAVEAAKAKVPKDLSIYKASRVSTLKKALKAAKEGYYASQQSVVDGFAEAIEKAVAALEKEKLTLKLKAVDADTGKTVKGAEFTVTDTDGKTVKAASAGVYSLDDGKYTIKASAEGYEDETLKKHSVTVDETLTLDMTKEEVIPEGTTIFKENEKDPSKTNLFNTTPMFKVTYGKLVTKNGKSKLTITLSGSGYHYLYKGTYEEALANGLNKDSWIAGKQNSEGKWEFVIPVKKGETQIPVISISQTHLEKAEAGEETLGQAMFARQLVLDLKKNTLTAGDYDAVVDIEVISKTAVFEPEAEGTMEVVGGPSSNNYACKPVITMKNQRFTEAFIGTAEHAAMDGVQRIELKKNTFTFELVNSFGENGREKMFEDKEPAAVAFYDSEEEKWIDYKLTIDKAAATVTIEALAGDETPPETPADDTESDDSSSGDSGSGAWTAPADADTTLADGVYTPDDFRYSGGSGKIIITCTQVEVRNGQAYATIRFGKPNGGEASVDRLRAAGTEYSGFNTFTIPVELNTNQTVVARTVAMSAPHWIEYSIYIMLAEPGSDTSDADAEDFSENTATLDKTAPKIPGLTAEGEIEVTYTDLLKIFTYKDGYYLIEVNTYSDTYRDSVEYRTKAEKDRIAEAAGTEEKEEQTEVTEEGTVVESISELIADLYRSEIIKYLVVPEDAEVPAGLDKEIIIVRQPADKTYVSSADALDMLDELGVVSNVTTVGLEEKDITSETILAGLEKEKDEEGCVVFAGGYDDWDLRTMILQKTNLAISSSEILPDDKKTAEEDMENFIRLGERAAQMEMALFVDRSSDEENDLAKAEWYKAYGVIFGADDEADRLYKAVVGKASEEDKKDALKDMEERTETSEKNREEAEKAAAE